jgi:hypothetical protein
VSIHTTPLLTTEEAQQVAEEWSGRRERSDWSNTSINMASVTLTEEGGVMVHLLGLTERHASWAAFCQAYGLRTG